jgi:hypothetical protein
MSEQPVVGTEPLVATLARKFAVDVNTGSLNSPIWTRVKGVSGLNPTVDSNLEDDSDYDSDGWGSSTKTGMTWSLEITAMRKVGIESRAYDPAQEALRLAAERFGAAGSVQVRWYDRDGGPEAYRGVATVAYSTEGGAYTALASATITLTGQGARIPITNPVAAAAGPGISLIAPATGPAAGGTLVVLTGSGFLGTTAVTFGNTVATQFRILDDTRIAATSPVHAAGAVQVTVTDPIDTSNGVTFTYA